LKQDASEGADSDFSVFWNHNGSLQPYVGAFENDVAASLSNLFVTNVELMRYNKGKEGLLQGISTFSTEL